MNPFIRFAPWRYFSHLLIVISAGVFLTSLIFPDLRQYAMNSGSLYRGDYMRLFLQFLFYQFLHGGIMHLAFNSYFLYTIGPELEPRMSDIRFRIFFLLNTLFVGIALLLVGSPNTYTVGISGFCMALLAYLWIDLHTLRHPMANQIGFMLALNVGLGLVGNISLIGHVAGAVFGLLWWWGRKWF